MSSAVSLGSEVYSRYLPFRFSSAFILALSNAQQPAGGAAQEPVQVRHHEIFPRSSARLVALRASVPANHLPEPDGQVFAESGVPDRGFGL